MNCLNAIGSGINCKKSTDTLNLNDYVSSGKTQWTATISGLMTLKVVGGGGRGGGVGTNLSNALGETIGGGMWWWWWWGVYKHAIKL